MIEFSDSEKVYNVLEEHEGALFIPECDSAIIGYCSVEREGDNVLVCCYDYDLLVDHFAKEFSVDNEAHDDPFEQAIEWVDFNIVGYYGGKYTPVIVYKNEEDEYELAVDWKP